MWLGPLPESLDPSQNHTSTWVPRRHQKHNWAVTGFLMSPSPQTCSSCCLSHLRERAFQPACCPDTKCVGVTRTPDSPLSTFPLPAESVPSAPKQGSLPSPDATPTLRPPVGAVAVSSSPSPQPCFGNTAARALLLKFEVLSLLYEKPSRLLGRLRSQIPERNL